MRRAAITDSLCIGSGYPLVLIGGPCVLESSEATVELAGRIDDICTTLAIPFVFKGSFDKANRTSIQSYRGVPLEKGLEILSSVKRQVKVPVLTDIHESHQASAVAEVADVLQIPAFLCRQTDLVLAAAATHRPVNVKKAPFLSPEDIRFVVEKLKAGGAEHILLTERGTTFGYNELIADFRSLVRMRSLGYPVVFDATHCVQRPGGNGSSSGGDRQFIRPLARAAAAVGIDAIYCEIHPDPPRSPCDSATILDLKSLEPFLEEILAIDRVRRTLPSAVECE
jgi:2-dehydro-3-deoxyphosphooctonate aldolase (KDO 8-P synthase)